MLREYLTIELEGDVALSASAASVDGGRTLTRIPGAALLGAAAAQAYDKDAFSLYHSGEVRFHDAYPETAAGAALPMPSSLHRLKSEAGNVVHNLAVGTAPRSPLVQLRDGFLSSAGEVVDVRTRYSLRTALTHRGRARDGLLFGIEALCAGQTFRACVESADAELLERAVALLAERTVHLGHSRSAEFGRVRLRRASASPPWPCSDAPSRHITVWCTSDLALRDAVTGMPRLVPEAADFGLPNDEVRLAKTRSFVRTRRYSPFNGHRRRPDLERQVIAAGSVLVFEGLHPMDPSVVRQAAIRGLGEYLQDGLGQVVVQPTLLLEPRLELAHTRPSKPATDAPMPNDELGRWLRAHVRREQQAQHAWQLSRTWAEQFRQYRDGPPPAQWGEIRRMAARARVGGQDGAAFTQLIRDHVGLLTLRGVTAQLWQTRARNGKSAAQLFVHLLEQHPEHAVAAAELLGAYLPELMNTREAS